MGFSGVHVEVVSEAHDVEDSPSVPVEEAHVSKAVEVTAGRGQ